MIKEISGRQEEIIKASGKILTTSGVGGLTIRRLAEEMGFSEGAVYRHFKNKEEIIISMLGLMSERMDELYSRAISKTQTTEEKFHTLFQNQFSFFKKNPDFVVAVFSDGLMEESEKINEAILKIMGVKMKHLRPILQEGQKNKIFKDEIPLEALMHIVMGTFRLQMFKWRISGFKGDISRSGNKMIKSLLLLIKTNSTS